MKLRIAVPTRGKGGLEDVVCDVFGRANSFTIVDVEDGGVKKIQVLDNPVVSYQHGAGPIVVKMLVDLGVNVVLAAEFGPGVSILLDQHKITRVKVNAGMKVSDSVKNVLSQIQKS